MSNTSPLSSTDFAHAARRLGVPVAAIQAMYEVESSGRGFLADGQIKVNYEPHIMYRMLKEKFGLKQADEFRAQYPDLVKKKSGHLVKQSMEHQALDAAVAIDRDSALQSASWGAPQIMGFHWKRLGFQNVQAFVNRMFQGEVGQLDTFCRFIETDRELHSALLRLDWRKVASIYNGPNYEAGGYHDKLAKAFRKYS